ncbi:MAG: redoxin family protein, partial [Myxococcota bacterium]
ATSPASDGGATPPAGAAAAAQQEEAAPPPAAAELNDAPPMSLEAWRKIKDEGSAAARTEDLGQRIAQCKAFVAKHGDHKETTAVLTALADALVENGNYDADELSKFIEQRCANDEDATQLPMELVREYHVKHNLPLASSLRLLNEARDRIATEWDDDVTNEKDESARKRASEYLSYRKIQTFILEGRVYLQHGEPRKAAKALAKGHAQTETFPSDIVMMGADGKKKGTLGSGLLDDLHVLTAAAKLELGDKEGARKAFTRAVGFVNDVEMRKIYTKTRLALGLRSDSEQEITAEAEPAQDFALKDMKGKTVKLSDYRGKVVLVTFWATWCGPCKKEMPELKKFLAAHKDKGVAVVAINIDNFTERSKVKPFLEKEGLDTFDILYEDAEQLGSYNYRGIPALYVIDREGRVAHARTGYDPDLKNKLNNEVTALIDGSKDPSRDLFTVEMAPKGWSVLWKQPVTGDVNALAVAQAEKGVPGEIGAVGRKGLMRWSQTGEEQSAEPIAGYTESLAAADLDGDGRREWIVGGWRSLKVLDASGKGYWDHATARMAEVSKVADLNGDGFKEIVLQDDDRVVAMKAVPEPLWKTEAIDELESVVVRPNGDVIAQADGMLTTYAPDGRVKKHGAKAPNGRYHRATLDTAGGDVALYGGRWDNEPNTDHDIDGDGRNDIVLSGDSGLVAFDADGKAIMRLRGKDTGLNAVVGDLDGKPGAEVAVFVEHYGLVVLGGQH